MGLRGERGDETAIRKAGLTRVMDGLTMGTKAGQRRGAIKGSGMRTMMLAAVTVCVACCFSAARGQGQEETLHYKIQEESDVGSFVGNVARDSQLYSRFSQDEFQQLQYSISTQGSKFTIDENTSTIRLSLIHI